MTIRPDLLTQVDWRHYQPPHPEKKSPAPSWFPLKLFSRPAKESAEQGPVAAPPPRTIAQGLAAPDETIYCRVAQLYDNVKKSLSDYPAMPPCWHTIVPTPHRIISASH